MEAFKLNPVQKKKLKEIKLEVCKDIEDPKPEEKRMVNHLFYRYMCLTDLYFLGTDALELGKAKRGRKYIIDPVFHRWMTERLQQEEDMLILVPRRHLKTTWVKCRIVQRLLQDPNRRIALYSATSNLVEDELADIKRLLAMPKILAFFSDKIPPPGKNYANWQRSNSTELTVRRDEKASMQENQVEVYGVGATVTGKHFDEHYYDDLFDYESVQTTDQIKKTIDWYGYTQGILEPDGLEVTTGTPYHYADFYAWLKQEKIYKKIYHRPAIVNGKPVYKFYTHKMFDRLRKRMGDYKFSSQYMLDPTPREDMLFPPPQPIFHELPENDYTYYISVDPAATTETYSDFTAIVVAAVDPSGMVWFVDALSLKKKGNEVARILIQMAERFRPRLIGIELGMQEHLRTIINMTLKEVEEKYGRRIKLPIEAIPVKQGRRTKYDKISWSLGSMVREGRVRVKNTLRDLIDQMNNYNPNYQGKDDLVDAAAMTFQLMDNLPFRRWREPLFGKPMKDWYTIEELFPKETTVKWADRFVS